MKLSLVERETILLYNQAEPMAEVYTHDPRLMEKLELLAKKHPDQITREDAHNFTVAKRLSLIEIMVLIPARNSSEASCPRSISPRRYSHSAVRSGDCSCSGSTVIRETASWEGRSCTVFLLFFRSRKPADTSFSKIPARVAGVPRPFRSASSGIFSFPAVSIADNKVSSESFCQGGAWIFFILLTQILSLLLPE